MRCSCCNAETETGKAKCSYCGFPVLVGADDTEMTRKLIQSHKEKKLGKIKIFVKAYQYEENNESIVEKQFDYLHVSDAVSLQLNDIKWLSNSFEEITSDQPLELEIRIVKDDECADKTAIITPDRIIIRSSIGIVLCDGFTVKFVVGRKEDYCYSEPIDLV